MAAASKNIFMGLKKPSDLSLLVSIPMYMYRIQTNQFASGLNFFQKSVLKLKYLPKIKNAKIAELLGLDESLVNVIINQLTKENLLNEDGTLTDEGLEMRDNACGFIINDNKNQVGYVFSYEHGDKYFPYYQSQVAYAQIINDQLSYDADNGTRNIDAPIEVDEIENNDILCPNEGQILRLIKNSSQRELLDGDEYEDLTESLFNIKFIPSNIPEIVNVCTYIYLPQSENDSYEDDWQVLDPFGTGNSYELKLYIESLLNDNSELRKLLYTAFGSADTEGKKSFLEGQKWIKEKTEEYISAHFGDDFFLLSSSIQATSKSVIEYHLRIQETGSKSIDQIQNMFINMQATLETILLDDTKDREDTFLDMDNNLGQDESLIVDNASFRRMSQYERKALKKLQIEKEQEAIKKRKEYLKMVFKKKWLSNSTEVPSVLLAKTSRWNGKSLLDYLMKFVLSFAFQYDIEDCGILSVFRGRVDKIVKLADLRNNLGHGGSNKSTIKDEQEAEYFLLFNNIIKDYLKITK